MGAPYSSKEHYTGQAIRERMLELDFKEKFIGQLLKEYPVEKIEGKLDLLMERRSIQNPAGWLRTALKNDYRGEEEEGYDEEPAEENEDDRYRGVLPYAPPPNVIASSDLSECGNPVNTPEQISREKAIQAIKLIQDNLSSCTSPFPSGKRAEARENVGV